MRVPGVNRLGLLTLVAMLAAWLVVTAVLWMAPFDRGLRGQYFADANWTNQVATVIDDEISTAQVFERWHAAPPPTFSVQWSGYLQVDRAGLYTFSLKAGDAGWMYLDEALVLESGGNPSAPPRTIDIPLQAGAHPVRLRYTRQHGDYRIDWQWARDGSPAAPIPRWALTRRPRPEFVAVARWLDGLWPILTGLTVAVAAGLAVAAIFSRGGARAIGSTIVGAAVCLALAWFYITAATAHAQRVNTFKARADQSGYLLDAEQVYANWHGRTPHTLIGVRNRMPLYAGFLALFYDPAMSDNEFFDAAKVWNIRLSVVLLTMLCAFFFLTLPRLLATNVSLIVAFGIFVFKAGYSQSELLFYTLFFGAVVALWRVLEAPTLSRRLGLAVLAGLLTALAHLTKAATLPLLGVFTAACAADAFVGRLREGERRSTGVWRAVVAYAVFLVMFLGVLSPYLINSKRTFGHYFYNVNTTFYVWYDDWPEASVGTALHGDGVGWPTMPDRDLPGVTRYWRSHTVHQIAQRILDGFKDMVRRSYVTFQYFNYVIAYVVLLAAVLLANRSGAANLIREHAATAMFLALYAGAYLFAIAFYAPISGTGTTRFLIAHLPPFFYMTSRFFSAPAIASTTWSAAGLKLRLTDAHVLVLAMLAFDLAFRLWPRLLNTYGGF